jgi:hypothetical protein
MPDYPHYSSRIQISDNAPAGNPPAGSIFVYSESGKLKQKTSAGVVTDFTAGGGGGDIATDALWDAKGDLAVGTGADTAARLAVGATNGHVLTIDSAESTGLKWAAAPTADFDLTIVTESGTAITLDASNCFPDYIRCTSGSAITLTLAAGQSAAAGRYWIIRQAAAGVATVDDEDSTPAAITRNGDPSTAGQHTEIAVILVADGVVDIIGGTT